MGLGLGFWGEGFGVRVLGLGVWHSATVDNQREREIEHDKRLLFIWDKFRF